MTEFIYDSDLNVPMDISSTRGHEDMRCNKTAPRFTHSPAKMKREKTKVCYVVVVHIPSTGC
jgi:hypothetical protein